MRRRRPEVDPYADVPEHLRRFDPAWLEVARQGPDGYAEALDAAQRWRAARRGFVAAHGIPDGIDVVEWLKANLDAVRMVGVGSR